ncbi:hypothetical protein BGZ80_000749, partial [Entomortierella chlamydospora]
MSSQKRQTNDIDDNSQKDVKRRSRAHIPDINSAGVNTNTLSSYERITGCSNSDSSDDIVIKMEEENNPGPIETRNALMWFRTDLRLKDNKALYEASMRSKVGGADRYLIALFIISEEEWAEHDEAPIKIDFWMRNLTSLKRSLDELSIPLIVKTAKLKSDLVKVIESVVEEMDISHVFWNADLMVDEQRRDKAVRKALQRMSVHVEECESEFIVPPSDIRTKDYQKCRDAPIQEGTSVMSPYLTSGVITNRQCLVAAREANKNKISSGDEGLKSWIKELAWK